MTRVFEAASKRARDNEKQRGSKGSLLNDEWKAWLFCEEEAISDYDHMKVSIVPEQEDTRSMLGCNSSMQNALVYYTSPNHGIQTLHTNRHAIVLTLEGRHRTVRFFCQRISVKSTNLYEMLHCVIKA
jgi:hypothetical protein